MLTSPWLRAALLVASLAVAGRAVAQTPPPPAYPPPAAYPPSYAPPATTPPPPTYAPPPTYPPPAAAPVVVAQPPPQEGKVQLSAYTGWQMNGDISTYAGTLVIDDAQNYGVSLDYRIAPGTGVQLIWIYNDTKAHFSSYDPFYPSTKDFTLQQHYFQIGGNKGFRRGKVETFGGGTLGAALFMPGAITTVNGNTNTYSASDRWAFAMTFGAGAKIFFTEKLALRLEGRLMLPMFFSGGSVYVGTGGSGMAVSAGIPSVQGAFMAGLTFQP